jgi:hypothetical protein
MSAGELAKAGQAQLPSRFERACRAPPIQRRALEILTAPRASLQFSEHARGVWNDDPTIQGSPVVHRRNILIADGA